MSFKHKIKSVLIKTKLIKIGQKTVSFVDLRIMNKSFTYKNLKYRGSFFKDFLFKNFLFKRKAKQRSNNGLLVLLFLSVFLVVGCSSTYAPVEQRDSRYYKNVKKKYAGKTPTYHKVQKGETLYSIAWKYSQDYKSLAYRNKIKSPYHIFVGDKLRLTSYTTSNKKRSSTAAKTKVSNTNGRTSTNKTSSNTKYNKNSSYKTRTASKSSKKVVSTTSSKTKKSSTRAVNKNKKTATFNGSKRLSWSWPVKGKIIQRYSPGSGKKGIDISAAKGALIKSAEAGKVVYSGQGLVGYGRLIIIKHNDTYLSAYAHNQSLLVNEGQIVQKGQNIARLGRSGTDRFKLHFEIRKNGKPVNPMSYLPR